MDKGVFISYRRTDQKWAELLAKCLASHSVSLWYDGMIDPGQDWRDEIVENIRLAKIIIVLFSSDVNTSTELKKELAVADQTDTIIIVVRIENVEPEAGYRYELSNRNWFDAFDNPARDLKEVAAYIADVLKNPSGLERHFKLSAEELLRRRRQRLFGHSGRLRNNTFLLLVFIVFSVIQFFAYTGSTDAIANRVAGGASPFRAILEVAFVTSFGSPLLLLAATQQDLSGTGLLIYPCSAIIITVMIFCLRNFISWIQYFWLKKFQ